MKKFLALFLIFSLIILSVNLYAKERRGAKLLITKKDGQQIRGELIAVKIPLQSILLLDSNGKDMSINMEEIKVIVIDKPSKLGKRVKNGALIGGGIGLIVGIAAYANESGWLFGGEFITVILGLIGGAYDGVLIGGIIDFFQSRDVAIQVEGLPDPEIGDVLVKLQKKARIRYYK